MATTTAYLIQPTDELRTTFLEAMAEHQQVDGRPDADGLTLADLNGDTCLTHYAEGLRTGTALRPGTEPMKPTVWWYVQGTGDSREYLGRVSLRHHPATETLGEQGSQLWVTIRPSQRVRGLGKALLTAAFPFAQANGITEAVVELASTNEAGQRLVEACGGRQVEHRPAEGDGRHRFLLPIA